MSLLDYFKKQETEQDSSLKEKEISLNKKIKEFEEKVIAFDKYAIEREREIQIKEVELYAKVREKETDAQKTEVKPKFQINSTEPIETLVSAYCYNLSIDLEKDSFEEIKNQFMKTGSYILESIQRTKTLIDLFEKENKKDQTILDALENWSKKDPTPRNYKGIFNA